MVGGSKEEQVSSGRERIRFLHLSRGVFRNIERDLRVPSKIDIMKNIFSGSDQNVFSTFVSLFFWGIVSSLTCFFLLVLRENIYNCIILSISFYFVPFGK